MALALHISWSGSVWYDQLCSKHVKPNLHGVVTSVVTDLVLETRLEFLLAYILILVLIYMYILPPILACCT
jgi:hypothetical protein